MRYYLSPLVLLRNIWLKLPVGKHFFWKINIMLSGHKREFLLKAMPKEAIVAEIGVYKGDFSKRILDMTNPAKLHLIDPWKYEQEKIYNDTLYGGRSGVDQNNMDAIFNDVVNKFAKEIKNNQVIIHRASAEEACNNIKNNYFDWIYIDGNHLYEYVKKDLECYYQKVKVGGFITGDDYAEGGWWGGGVKKAVDEFVNNGSVKLVQIKKQQFILQKLA